MRETIRWHADVGEDDSSDGRQLGGLAGEADGDGGSGVAGDNDGDDAERAEQRQKQVQRSGGENRAALTRHWSDSYR